MRIWPWSGTTETDEERIRRLSLWDQEMDELAALSREEIEGHPDEVEWHLRQFTRAISMGDREQIRAAAFEVVRVAPLDPVVRFMVSGAHQRIEDDAEALGHLGVALALAPDFYPAHRHMADLLFRRGEDQAAEKILALGWEVQRRELPRRERAAARDRWFRRRREER